MWVLGQTRALGIKPLCNGHGDVTAVSTGPPPVMDLGIKRPGLLGGPVERTAHRPRFGASPSLLCSSVTKKRTKCHEAGGVSWVPELCREDMASPNGLGIHGQVSASSNYRRSFRVHLDGTERNPLRPKRTP